MRGQADPVQIIHPGDDLLDGEVCRGRQQSLLGIPVRAACVDFSPSGSDDLAKKIAHAVRENDKFRVIMLDQHGIIAVGVDLVQAYNFADLAEEMAKIAYISSTIPG